MEDKEAPASSGSHRRAAVKPRERLYAGASADSTLLRLAELEAAFEKLSRENWELERACERLERDRNLLELILDSLPYPLYVIDAATHEIVRANAAARLGELDKGATCHALIHASAEPCDSAENPCPVDEMRRTKKPVVVEHVHITPEGTPYYAEVHAFPVLDDRGEVVRAIECTRDITRRRRAELDREKYVGELEAALARVRTLRGLVPICSSCKKIRDDRGYWESLEVYLQDHSEAEFSHSYCPECAAAARRALKERG